MKVEADSAAKCYARGEITIDSGIEKVFGILSDINNWPEWQINVSMASIDGNTETGNKFKWKAGGLTIRSKLHTVSPFQEIGWTGRIFWIKAVHNWFLFDDNGKTRVVVEESLKGLGSSGMRVSLKEGINRNLEELKKASEK